MVEHHGSPASIPLAPPVGHHGPAAAEPPLVVDLDGTLVSTNLLIEGLLALVRVAPLAVLTLPFALFRGRAAAKRAVARRVTLEVATLPYRQDLLAHLREEAVLGRRLVLATANDGAFAEQVARHLGLFGQIIASDGVDNLKGARKRDRLVQRFGEKAFDYAGDARSDLPVWSSARYAIVVGSSHRLRAAVAARTTVTRSFQTPVASRWPVLRALRAHHWIKNLLVFVPLLAAQRFNEPTLAANAALSFGGFCLAASAFYVFNDLLDLDADRRHPRKRLRPIAAGELPLGQAIAMVPLLLGAAFVLTAGLPAGFLLLLASYCALTCAYSLRLKQVVLLDVIVLAGLYVLRILAGAEATDVPVSRWLLGFSMFTFLSLAMMKRHTEIVAMRIVTPRIRGYRASDATLLLAMGVASGYLAAVILAIYAETATAEQYYARREFIWLICPAFVYWISYLWLMAERNRMTFDPVVFAVRNRTSYVLIMLMVGLSVLAL